MRNPLQATGWLVRDSAEKKSTFLGSCFAFRRLNYLLTAAHCVRDAEPASLSVHMHGDLGSRRRIKEIIIHQSADLAILRLVDGDTLPDTFGGETNIYNWGMSVSAFGYPEDTGLNGLKPTPRFFRGNIQRMFKHKSHLGYKYDAVELSFGAPGGLSGGPVAPDSDYSMVMGVVVENLTSTTYLATVSQEISETSSRTEVVHSMINYAIAVRLDPVTDWLDEHVPYPGAIT